MSAGHAVSEWTLLTIHASQMLSFYSEQFSGASRHPGEVGGSQEGGDLGMLLALFVILAMSLHGPAAALGVPSFCWP